MTSLELKGNRSIWAATRPETFLLAMVCTQVWCFWKAVQFTVPLQPCGSGREPQVPLPLCWMDSLHIWALDVHCRYSNLVILGSSGLAQCVCSCLMCRVMMKCVQASWKEQVGIPTMVAADFLDIGTFILS